MTRLALTLSMVVAVAVMPHAQKAAPLPTLYVFTQQDPSGLIDKDAKARADSVAGITKALRSSKVVRVVTEKADAMIVLEVTRGGEVTEADSLGALTNAINATSGGATSLKPKEAETRTRPVRYGTLSVGTYTTELYGQAYPWGAALAKAVEQWVKMNAAQLQHKD